MNIMLTSNQICSALSWRERSLLSYPNERLDTSTAKIVTCSSVSMSRLQMINVSNYIAIVITAQLFLMFTVDDEELEDDEDDDDSEIHTVVYFWQVWR